MKKIISILLALIFVQIVSSQSKVSLREEQMVLPTYPVAPADKNPIFFNNETHQGAAKHIYPYALNDTYLHERIEKAYKALILENDYIELCITPEIGGKLYYATDKTNGYNFIYKNDVVKPSNIGMTGAWVSGGIEWCVLHHHRASTFLPVNYDLQENEDGSKTIWIGETEPSQQIRWTMGITAFPGKSYFEVELKIHNATPFTHSFLYWANVATHTNQDYQILFPPSVQLATYHAKNDFTRWPVSTEIYRGQDFTQGVDISYWKNSKRSNSFFAHNLKEDFMGGYDHGRQSGTIHVGNHHISKGAKVWEWGSGPRGQATEARLTENAGPYVEIMVGTYSDNQPDYSWIKPYEVKTSKQYWYPVKGIQGFKNANKNGAVNLEERDNNTVFLGYYSTQKIETAKIILQNENNTVFEEEVSISPEAAFSQSIKLDRPFKLTNLYTQLVNTKTGEVLISYKPEIKEKVEELPEIVEAPEEPENIKTVEELFLTGKRIEQFHHATYQPLNYYCEALKRDPGDIRTNTAIGNIHLQNGNYSEAREYLGKAIERLTRDYTRPKDGEALYLQGLTLKALERYEAATDTLYRAAWDYSFSAASYLELARISTLKGDFPKAIEQINESLATNARNNSAIILKAVLLRKTGNDEVAEQILKSLLNQDPLDLKAANETYLLAKMQGDIEKADEKRLMLEQNMRSFDQNYLDVATSYINDGLPDEAQDILSRFNGTNPIVDYYLGYLEIEKGNKTKAADHFKKATAQSVDYVFPFRLLTVKVLESALEHDSTDGKALYYLGNIYYHRNQRDKAINYWEEAVKHNWELAVAHRNLGWAYYNHLDDGEKAISAYEEAIKQRKDQAIYYEELDELYEMSNASIDTRLKLFEGNHKVVSHRDDAFVRQIKVLTLAGKADKAVEYLDGKTFSYREGSSKTRDVVINAHLASGLKCLKENKPRKALEMFTKAQVPDEEASESRTGNRNIQVHFLTGLAHFNSGDKAKAEEYFNKAKELTAHPSEFVSYYKASSLLKLGEKNKAENILNSMLEEAEAQFKQSPKTDFFNKFGAGQAENERLSYAYLLKGLAYKGLGKTAAAKENLRRAIDLSKSNLWAQLELPM
jgi:tetratricopeptide (TPR) repeat protein